MLSCWRRVAVISLGLVLTVVPLLAVKDFILPHAENAASYPSHDAHTSEHVTAAIDLYNTSPKDEIFGTKYLQEGILPVFLVITNQFPSPSCRRSSSPQAAPSWKPSAWTTSCAASRTSA